MSISRLMDLLINCILEQVSNLDGVGQMKGPVLYVCKYITLGWCARHRSESHSINMFQLRLVAHQEQLTVRPSLLSAPLGSRLRVALYTNNSKDQPSTKHARACPTARLVPPSLLRVGGGRCLAAE